MAIPDLLMDVDPLQARAAGPQPPVVGVDGSAGASLLRGVIGLAARVPVAGRFVRPAATVTASVLRRAQFTAADLFHQDAARIAEQVGRLADLLIPALVREVLARIDLDSIVDRVDLDRAVARVDLEAVVRRVDVEAVVSRVDLDQVVARVDVDAVVAQVDLDAIIGRIDLNGIAGSLDLDAIVDRLDVDRAAARLDLDVIIERMDVLGLARYVVEGVNLPQLIRSSTESISHEMVQDVRDTAADGDRAVERLVDRLLRRPGRATPPKPRAAPEDDGLPVHRPPPLPSRGHVRG